MMFHTVNTTTGKIKETLAITYLIEKTPILPDVTSVNIFLNMLRYFEPSNLVTMRALPSLCYAPMPYSSGDPHGVGQNMVLT